MFPGSREGISGTREREPSSHEEKCSIKFDRSARRNVNLCSIKFDRSARWDVIDIRSNWTVASCHAWFLLGTALTAITAPKRQRGESSCSVLFICDNVVSSGDPYRYAAAVWLMIDIDIDIDIDIGTYIDTRRQCG